MALRPSQARENESEDEVTLGELHAFLDAALDTESDLSDCVTAKDESSDGDHVRYRDDVPKKRGKKRMREEVLRLRGECAALERQVQSLAERDAIKKERNALSEAERAAMQERHAAAWAKVENRKLKKRAHDHLALVQMLENMVEKRRIVDDDGMIDDDELCARDTRERDAFGPVRSTRDCQIYDLLRSQIRAYAATPCEEFQSHKLYSQTATDMQRWETGVDATTQNKYLALFNTMILPFDFRAGARVVWTQVMANELKLSHKKTRTEIIESTEDLLITKQLLKASYLVAEHQITTEYSISKRMVFDDRVMFAWEALIESEGEPDAIVCSTTSTCQLVQRGWLKLSPLLTQSGAAALSLQTYNCMAPAHKTIDDRLLVQDSVLGQEAHRTYDIGQLKSLLVPLYEQILQSIRQCIGNTLLATLVKKSCGSVGTSLGAILQCMEALPTD
uniref:Uncharacterized protein n=1 Tax=Globisporangium ultimum (strain ATCC 200006 / CBS 805.95 / DAOM BR144) TaxID=431595 RepID=K3W9K1_GLOUD